MQITDEDFKERVYERFQDRFIYLDKYVNMKTPMRIVCREHGEFLQAPNLHLKSSGGCPKCGKINTGNKLRKTTEMFKQEVEEKFGKGIYDFTNTEYINAKTKLEVLCLICGNITEKIAETFLRHGCKTCAIKNAAIKKTKYLKDGSRKYKRPEKGNPRIPFDKYYEDVKETHGEGRYDYNVDSYQGSNFKLEIECLLCGLVFEQNAAQHKLGSGCPTCAIAKSNKNLTKSFSQFKQESDNFHGEGKFDIDEDTYKNNRSILDIICLTCGFEFQQAAYSHLRNGCPECAKIEIREKLAITQEEFISRVKEIHGDNCSYEDTVYINMATKIVVLCNLCGNKFEQLASSHMAGSSCHSCGGNKRKTTEQFKEEAKVLHGDAFDYSKVEYGHNGSEEVIIGCNTCGNEFEQKPTIHLSGSGCRVCNKSKGERKLIEIFKRKEIEVKPQFELSSLKRRYFDFRQLHTNKIY